MLREMARLGPAALRVVAGAYLVGIFVYGVGCTAQYKVIPGDVSYYLEVAALFPNVSRVATEYRVEGWACHDNLWEELDYRPYFRLHQDDKENVFQRVLSLYRQDTPTMEDLEDYIVVRHNAGGQDGVASGQPIGGVRFVKVAVPIPKPGEPVVRYKHKSLATYPKNERHIVYRTPKPDIDARCGVHDEPEPDAVEPDKAGPSDKTSAF
jgi:hypothetical protein